MREYWIVDPELHQVKRSTLKGNHFEKAGIYGNGEIACNAVPGFKICRVAIFDPKSNVRELAQIAEAAPHED